MPKALVEMTGQLHRACAPLIVTPRVAVRQGLALAALTSLDSDCRNLALASQMLGCQTCAPRLWDDLAWESSVNQQHSSS